MSLTVVRALLILNAAKKGWSESARKKAAATRKAKAKSKAQPKFKGSVGDALSSLMKSPSWKKLSISELDSKVDKLIGKDNPEFTSALKDQIKRQKDREKRATLNAAKKGWTKEARAKAAATRKAKKKTLITSEKRQLEREKQLKAIPKIPDLGVRHGAGKSKSSKSRNAKKIKDNFARWNAAREAERAKPVDPSK